MIGSSGDLAREVSNPPVVFSNAIGGDVRQDHRVFEQ